MKYIVSRNPAVGFSGFIRCTKSNGFMKSKNNNLWGSTIHVRDACVLVRFVSVTPYSFCSKIASGL